MILQNQSQSWLNFCILQYVKIYSARIYSHLLCYFLHDICLIHIIFPLKFKVQSFHLYQTGVLFLTIKFQENLFPYIQKILFHIDEVGPASVAFEDLEVGFRNVFCVRGIGYLKIIICFFTYSLLFFKIFQLLASGNDSLQI